jgi:serine/threonine-protein kinase
MGTLILDTTPWSIVSMGGKTLGSTPILGAKLSPGPHTLTLRNPDLGIETEYTVTIEAGKTTSKRLGLE